MSLDREKAREVLLSLGLHRDGVEADLDALEACVTETPVFGWDDMLELLRSTYPESMIPQYAEEDYGNGPQVVSLLRLVTQLRQATPQTIDRDALIRFMDKRIPVSRPRIPELADGILALLRRTS